VENIIQKVQLASKRRVLVKNALKTLYLSTKTFII